MNSINRLVGNNNSPTTENETKLDSEENNHPALIFRHAKKTSPNCYLLNFSFNASSGYRMYNTRVFNDSVCKIRDNFSSLLKDTANDEQKPNIKSIRGFASSAYQHTSEIRFDSEPELREFEQKLKQNLVGKDHVRNSNIDRLLQSEIEVIKYNELQVLINALRGSEDFKLPDNFPYLRVISISDGKPNGLFAKSTAIKLKKFLDNSHLRCDITATDINEDNDEIKKAYGEIKYLKIDNKNSFSKQGVSSKYDLILMIRGLCNCVGDDTEDACGGIKINNPKTVLTFLNNVASLLDLKCHSRAFLEGENPNPTDSFVKAIEEFNKKSDFVASIEINFRGEFSGIMIMPRQ